MLDRSLGKTLLIWLTIAVFGLGGAFGAVATWRGVAAELWGSRTPGTVSGVRCEYVGDRGGSLVCQGRFSATDGSVHGLTVLVKGGNRDPEQHGRLVRAVNTWGVTTVQHDDTVYVGNSAPSAIGSIVLAVFLSLFALVVLGPALVLIALRILIRTAGRKA